MQRKKIVIVGGGSNAWAPALIRDMLLTGPISDSEFVLYDINKQAGDLVKAFAEKLNRLLGTKASFVSTDHRQRAFRSADYFIITISTGGLKAMASDLAIPEKHGIYHTVGDTSGPGGWARCLRNFEVFRRLAGDINRWASGAMVLNYTNPMTTLTDILSRFCEGPVVGLCHGLFENLDFIKRFYKVDSEEDISAKYAGLNHFFWITELKVKGRDALQDLKRRLRTQSFTDLLRESSPDPMGFTSKRELATELFRWTGVMPYLGDRHTCEFLPSYITSRRAMKKYHLVRTTVRERREGFQTRERRLRQWLREDPLPDYFRKRGRETAADIIAAHAQGRAFIDVGNLPNIGQVDNLPRGAVVETAVRVDQNGFSPIAFGPLPEVIRGWVEPCVHVFALSVEACLRRDKRLALQALRLDPVCSHLNGEEVNRLGQELLKAHQAFLPAFR